MSRSYLSIPYKATAEYEIKKSIFYGDVAPAKDESEAIAFLEEIKEKRPGATHHVHAYRVGYPVLLERFSDDGEPSGTAGMPVLEVLRREELNNVVLVVTRFFGGTLLGAGGLVRAYAKAATLSIQTTGKVSWQIMQKLSFSVPYSNWGKVEYELHNLEYIDLKDITYGLEVSISLLCPEDKVPTFINWLKDILSGQIMLNRGSSAYYPAKE